jgi:hypothetical protein
MEEIASFQLPTKLSASQGQLVGSNITTIYEIRLVGHTAAASVNLKVLASGLKVGVDTGVEVGDGSGSHLEGLSWSESKAHRADMGLKETFWYWNSLGLVGSPWDRHCAGQGQKS